MSNEKSSDALGWVILIAIGLVIWGFSSWIGGEREGSVTYSDCRETINLKPESYQKYYKKFTCEYTKTEAGKIMSGTCVHVDTTGGLFSDSNECKRAYVYEKKPQIQCSSDYPWLGYDGKCWNGWDYGRVNTQGE